MKKLISISLLLITAVVGWENNQSSGDSVQVIRGFNSGQGVVYRFQDLNNTCYIAYAGLSSYYKNLETAIACVKN